MFEAIHKGTQSSSSSLIIGDPEGHVGIITLWTKSKSVAEKLDPKKYAVIGQLFSAERGLDILIRNLLANTQITNLVITGIDFSKSGIVLDDFFKNGFEKGVTDLTGKPCWRVKSKFPGYVGLDIPEHVLNELREAIAVIRTTDVASLNFDTLLKPEKTRSKYVFVKPEEEKIKQYQGEYTGHIVRGKTVSEAWVKLLDVIMKFGKTSGTHYDDQQKEIVNLMSIISDEDPYNLSIPSFLPTNEQRVKEYIPRITQDIQQTGKNYTYGSRMQSWFGENQVKAAITKLVREPNSRAVVISLWDPVKDLTVGGSPCLNHVWFRINENTKKLYMTCVFRSHDMFEGYPENLFALRVFQEEVRKQLVEKLKEANKPIDLILGDTICLSQSAHLYDDTWETCEVLIKQNLGRYEYHLSEMDPRGNFIITIDKEAGEIVVEHTSTTNEKIGEYRAKTAEEMTRSILSKEKVVSLIPHAFDLGLELKKAEIALKLGLEYNQDQSLDFSQIVEVEVINEKPIKEERFVTY